MATLTPVQAKITGAGVTMVAASGGGDKIRADGHTALLVKNSDASSKTVTVAVPGNTQFGQAEPDVPIVMAAGAMTLIGPFPAALSDDTDRLVHITYSAVTSVTVVAVAV
jgi:hypothetical protein